MRRIFGWMSFLSILLSLAIAIRVVHLHTESGKKNCGHLCRFSKWTCARICVQSCEAQEFFFFVCSEIDWNLLTISNLIAQQMNEAASSVSSLRTQKKKKCCRVVIFIIRIWLFLFINVAIVAGWMQMNRVEPRKVSAPQTSARITTIEWYEQTNLYSLHVSGNRECEAKPNTQMLNQSKLCMNAAHKILILILLNFEKNRSSASILELVSFLRFVWPPFGPEKYEENT